jgi:heme-degrading monooxygenase HmoA
MIAVIFEVEPYQDRWQDYLDIAAELKPELEKIDGFVSIERFQSLVDKNRILSLSFFENEDAITKWRNLEAHRSAQASGRAGIFKTYRIRIAGVIRDYTMTTRGSVPADSLSIHDG